MKVLIIYESLYGNTEKIAKAIADTCQRYGSVQLQATKGLYRLEPQNADLLFMGCPTHNQNLSPNMKELLDHTAKKTLHSIKAIAFDTRYEMPRWLFKLSAGTAANKYRQAARKRGDLANGPGELSHRASP